MIMKVMAVSFFFIGLFIQKTYGQQVFIPNGKITFEKKINTQRNAADWDISEEAKDKIKKYKTSDWELYFDENKSLYKAKKKEAEEESFIFSFGGATNELYADYANQTRVLKRSIMGDDYLLRDTIPHVDWKILHDIRVISGYECRKALGRINDTVYVVAFYTDEILLKGGPEGFSGLPGMILGLAIPRFNTTWFATKIEGFTVHSDQIIPPYKGKKTESDRDMRKLIEIYNRYIGNKSKNPEDVKKNLLGFVL